MTAPVIRDPSRALVYSTLDGTLGQVASTGTLTIQTQLPPRTVVSALRHLRRRGLVQRVPGTPSCWAVLG